MSPEGTVDAPGDAPGVVEWQAANARVLKLRLYTHANGPVIAGDVLQNCIQVSDGQDDGVVVIGTTTIR